MRKTAPRRAAIVRFVKAVPVAPAALEAPEVREVREVLVVREALADSAWVRHL